MQNLAFLTIEQLREAIRSEQVSVDQLVDFFARRIQSLDPKIASVLELFDKESVLKGGCLQGPLAGIPGIIKDNIAMEGKKTSCASLMLEDFFSTYDATAVERLKAAGALSLGRANMDEFAMGSSTETSAFEKTKNPWDLERVPGGSSGGSAAAVAAGLVPWALGSDTGGSVRQPAAFCGIVGMKPTYGLVSRYGLVAYASSLDTIGTFTRTVKDNAMVMSAIAGHDLKDGSSLAVEPTDYAASLDGTIPEGIRIGVVEDAVYAHGVDGQVVQAIEAAVEVFKKLGAQVTKLKLPELDYSAAAYFILSRAEAASNLSRFDGVKYGMRSKDAKTLNEMYAKTRHDGFGFEVKKRILVGNYVLSAGHAGDYYEKAKLVKRVIRRTFVNAFSDVDLLIMPTQSAPAFKSGKYDVDPLQMDLQDYFTCPINLAGIPAISVPCGFTQTRLPIGLQLIGPHLSEARIYRVAHAYEQSTAWHQQYPEGF